MYIYLSNCTYVNINKYYTGLIITMIIIKSSFGYVD